MNPLFIILLVYLIGLVLAYILLVLDKFRTYDVVTFKDLRKIDSAFLLSWVVVLIYIFATCEDLVKELDDIVIYKRKK